MYKLIFYCSSVIPILFYSVLNSVANAEPVATVVQDTRTDNQQTNQIIRAGTIPLAEQQQTEQKIGSFTSALRCTDKMPLGRQAELPNMRQRVKKWIDEQPKVEIREKTHDKQLPLEVVLASPDLRRAWEDARTSIKLYNLDPEPYLVRGSVWTRLGNTYMGLRDVARAATIVSADPNSDLVKQSEYLGHLSTAILEAMKSPGAPLIADAKSYWGAGISRMVRYQLDRAFCDFSDAIAIDPDNALYWYSRALTLEELGFVDEAKSDERIGALYTSPIPKQLNSLNNGTMHTKPEIVQLSTVRALINRYRDQEAYYVMKSHPSPVSIPLCPIECMSCPCDDPGNLFCQDRLQCRFELYERQDRIRKWFHERGIDVNERLDKSIAKAPADLREAWKEATISLRASFVKPLAERSPDPYIVRGSVRIRLGNTFEGVRELAMASEILASDQNPDLVKRSYYLQIMSKAINEIYLVPFKRAQDRDNVKEAKSCWGHGIQHMIRCHVDLAILDFSDAISLDPTNSVFWYSRALALRELDFTKEAEQDVKIATFLEKTPVRKTVDGSKTVGEYLEKLRPMRYRSWLEAYRCGDGHIWGRCSSL